MQSPACMAMTIAVIAIALMFPGLPGMLNIDLRAKSGDVSGSTSIILLMDVAAIESEIQNISDYLQTLNISDSLEFISAEQGMEEFSANYSLGSLLTELPTNPLPSAYLINTDSSDAGAPDELGPVRTN